MCYDNLRVPWPGELRQWEDIEKVMLMPAIREEKIWRLSYISVNEGKWWNNQMKKKGGALSWLKSESGCLWKQAACYEESMSPCKTTEKWSACAISAKKKTYEENIALMPIKYNLTAGGIENMKTERSSKKKAGSIEEERSAGNGSACGIMLLWKAWRK